AIRPAPILDERANAPLGPDHHHHADHIDREENEHLHVRHQEPEAGACRRHEMLDAVARGRRLRDRLHEGRDDHALAPAVAPATLRPLSPSVSYDMPANSDRAPANALKTSDASE